MFIGILSDIHGDLESLEKALTLFKKQGVHTVVCAGDLVEKGRDDDGVVEVLRSKEIQCVQGNHDANAIRHFELSDALKSDDEVPLKFETIEYLKNLPATLSLCIDGEQILITHGIPSNNAGTVFHNDGVDRLSKQFKKDLARCESSIIIVGHTHFPFSITFKDKHIINPGATCTLKDRDSHTAGIFNIKSGEYTVYSLRDESKVDFHCGNVT